MITWSGTFAVTSPDGERWFMTAPDELALPGGRTFDGANYGAPSA
jgi:hypothetical protein